MINYCQICNKELKKKNKKFCSYSCNNKSRKLSPSKICITCKELTFNNKYCSRKCMGLDRIGNIPWNYKTKKFANLCILCKKFTNNKWYCSYQCKKLHTIEKLPESQLCECLWNCGQYAKPGKKFIHGHYGRGREGSNKGLKGPLNPLFGRPNIKTSEINKRKVGPNNPMYGKFGKDHPSYGHKQTEKFCSEQSIRMSQYWENGLLKPRWHNTKCEKTLENYLKINKISYEKQFRVGTKTTDFILHPLEILIEVDGCWAHGCKDHSPNTPNKDKFFERKKYFKKYKFDSIRIWEHELQNTQLLDNIFTNIKIRL